MKKYIRTKYGVYSVGDKETDVAVSTNHGWVFKRDIIAWADADDSSEGLESLVDEYVLGKTTYHDPCVAKLPLDFLKECVITEVYPGLTLYGSVWVDDDLKKVMRFDKDQGWVLL